MHYKTIMPARTGAPRRVYAALSIAATLLSLLGCGPSNVDLTLTVVNPEPSLGTVFINGVEAAEVTSQSFLSDPTVTLEARLTGVERSFFAGWVFKYSQFAYVARTFRPEPMIEFTVDDEHRFVEALIMAERNEKARFLTDDSVLYRDNRGGRHTWRQIRLVGADKQGVSSIAYEGAWSAQVAADTWPESPWCLFEERCLDHEDPAYGENYKHKIVNLANGAIVDIGKLFAAGAHTSSYSMVAVGGSLALAAQEYGKPVAWLAAIDENGNATGQWRFDLNKTDFFSGYANSSGFILAWITGPATLAFPDGTLIKASSTTHEYWLASAKTGGVERLFAWSANGLVGNAAFWSPAGTENADYNRVASEYCGPAPDDSGMLLFASGTYDDSALATLVVVVDASGKTARRYDFAGRADVAIPATYNAIRWLPDASGFWWQDAARAYWAMPLAGEPVPIALAERPEDPPRSNSSTAISPSGKWRLTPIITGRVVDVGIEPADASTPPVNLTADEGGSK
jgi:hypothetical protein